MRFDPMTTTAVAPPTTAPPVLPAGKRRAPRDWRGWLFVSPFMAVFALTFLAPVVYSIYLSLFRHQLIGGDVFVGLDNYTQAFHDPKLREGAVRVLIFLVVQVPIMLGLALAAALAIDSRRLAGVAVFRLGIFLPYAVPGVVAVLMWSFLYNDRMGLVSGAKLTILDLCHAMTTAAGPAAPRSR